MKKSLLNLVRGILNTCLDVCAPNCCLLCDELLQPSHHGIRSLCAPCFASLDPAPGHEELLNDLLRHFPDDRFCITQAFARFSAGRHDRGGILDLVHAIKYRGFTQLAQELGQDLGWHIQFQGQPQYDSIIPVPIHPARFRERGYNQAEAIAKGIANSLTLPLESDLVQRARYTTTQTRLSNQDRQHNMQHAFRLKPHARTVHNESFLIVDDVLTTGSTLNGIAQLLLESGARRVDVATLVKAE